MLFDSKIVCLMKVPFRAMSWFCSQNISLSRSLRQSCPTSYFHLANIYMTWLHSCGIYPPCFSSFCCKITSPCKYSPVHDLMLGAWKKPSLKSAPCFTNPAPAHVHSSLQPALRNRLLALSPWQNSHCAQQKQPVFKAGLVMVWFI